LVHDVHKRRPEERCRLTAAGLGNAYNVPATQSSRYRLLRDKNTNMIIIFLLVIGLVDQFIQTGS